MLTTSSASVGVGVALVGGLGLGLCGVIGGGFDFVAVWCFRVARVRVVVTWNFDFVLFSPVAILRCSGGRYRGRWRSRSP